LVVIEKDGQRRLRSLDWGFPRQTREGRLNGDLPHRIGLVADLTNPMWSTMVVDPRYRCLIVLTHFANPDGDQGSKTRTWFSVKDQPIMAWAGFCRRTEEFGPAYAGMTMAPNEIIPPTNDRMPVLLEPEDYDRWLRGSIEDVFAFQHLRPPFPSNRMKVERTGDLWRSGVGPPGSAPQLALL
jgi:putative SOS response-associated peptidase YedK